jgi:hypothetical protein
MMTSAPEGPSHKNKQSNSHCPRHDSKGLYWQINSHIIKSNYESITNIIAGWYPSY